MALPSNILSRNRSVKSLRDRRRSSGALSTTGSMHKPRRCIGDYYVGKTLGKGASGRVKLGVHRVTGEQVAIKIISKSHLMANPTIEKAVRREVAIMKLINHPNVMGLIDVIDDDSSPDLHLILEYVEGGELFEYLVSKGRLSEKEARHHFQQIILGLDYCHHHLICHRDLKPENLLLDSKNHIKIADFGMASLQPAGSMLETSCGSPHYASPEIVAGMPYNGDASDIWSCGVILYALLTGHLPFDDDNIRQLLKKVKAGRYTMPSGISRNAQDLIRRILVVDPAKRLTMRQIIAHPWFSEVEPANLASLPVPPTPQEIGHPVSSADEIDDRLLETIKFLWGENDQAAMVQALVSKEHNMQKVVYVLLQRHAEKYWQTEHDDEDEDDSPDDQPQQAVTARRRYRTITYRPERDRRCLSMAVDPNHTARRGSTPQRAPVPWVDDKSVGRRYSAATMRGERKGSMDASALPRTQHGYVPPVPDVPAVPSSSQSEVTKSEKLKKSQTFYERFVRNVLPSRRQSKDTGASAAAPPVPKKQSEDETIINESDITLSPASLTGTLRRKLTARRQSKVPMVPPKSTLRGTNKVEPEQPEKSQEKTQVQEEEKQQKRKSLNPKRLSIRVPNLIINHDSKEEDDSRAFFTFNGGAGRRQRKQVMSVFDSPQSSPTRPNQSHQQTHLPPPPGLSDGSTLSSSSSSSSSSHGSSQHAHMLPPTPVSAIDPKSMPPPPTFKTALVSSLDTQRRGSQATLGRRGSDQSFLSRPPTPSSTISENPPITPATPKASWLSNLFFFKQPKICSISVPHTDIADALRNLHRVMNKTVEARFYEKSDKHGTRYKLEIKANKADKMRQVKCRMEFIRSPEDEEMRIQFTQQQGDALFLAAVAQNVQQELLLESDV
ncbi:hypothetical protein BCR43DRAFT_480777 [Syncephalastrum racemosum]|uniref:non-specific serine/threonine protein kinase n=1 Tax=Syncephalastrum racemosum TaxID=13706 RepID=A0A1X2GZT4_SYNRA|nr:hypothetical protein BCR43DRAFT_480777 [Syncephalastrum racemosum]